jgi:glycosyltransferase involved in cell wall biosynthesis
MIHKKLRIAVIAPPWLALPVKGYGGIELVLQGLVSALKSHENIEVELFANGQRKLPGIKTHSLFKKEQFKHIYEPYFESYAIVMAHLEFAYNYIKKAGNFDIIHDHVPHVGPAFWSMASSHTKDLPPVLHTFHGPPFTSTVDKDFGSAYNTKDIEQIQDFGSWYASCISEVMALSAPENIKPRLMQSVYNGVVVKDFPFVAKKKEYFVTLARFAPYKGQHIAVELAAKLKKRLRMAGTVSDIGSNRKLLLELSNPTSHYRSDAQFVYYSDKILPYVLKYPRITYSGSLSGKRKMKFLSEAKALLFPVTWEEPFGMSVIEALACGTPVIAMNRGALPEIIEHGVNGFLANTVEEFEAYMLRINEIDPEECRRSVVDRFSNTAMAEKYISCYHEVLKREALK